MSIEEIFQGLKSRDKKRIKRILKLIHEIWSQFPDQRFFQLLYNYTRLGAKDMTKGVLYNYEDNDLEAYLYTLVKRIRLEKKLKKH